MGKVAIVYDSKTGNVERFMKKFPEGTEIYKVNEIDRIEKPFIFITYTTGKGLVPPTSLEFLNRNQSNLVGVASSGNRNWGDCYALAANKISTQFQCPIVIKFELSGTKRVVQDIVNFMEAI